MVSLKSMWITVINKLELVATVFGIGNKWVYT